MAFNEDLLGRMQTYFEQKLGVKKHRTGWLRAGTCPDCGKRGKFGVNLITNRTNCFSCSYRPKPLNIIMKLENLATYSQVFKFMGAFESAELFDGGTTDLLFTKNNNLPESFKLIGLGSSQVAKMARSYLENRGFNIMKLMMKGVGYCTKGEFAFRIIFPFYEKGKLVYFNAREFINFGLRFKNPNAEDFGTGKSLLIYNIDALQVYSRAYLVESITNAETLGEKSIAIGGKIPSDYQYSRILASPIKEVIVLLDPDAYWEALKAGLKLVSHKKVKVIKLPRIPTKKDPTKFKDVNDLGRKFILKIVKEQPWQNYSDIYREYIRCPRAKHSDTEA